MVFQESDEMASESDSYRGEDEQSPSADPLLGVTVSGYRIESQLGTGGMGTVYRATDVQLQRAVALKFLSPDLTGRTEAARQRFLREARTASALDHPNIGTVYHIGTAQGRLFIAMALYEGESLRQRLERGPLELGEIEKILAQLASGLKAAHLAGIVHRDLKPANVFITQEGLIKLLDFGLAKTMETGPDGSAPLTATGQILGTVPYMSPEQADGQGVDHRTDLWSLGVILYEMVANQRPFDGKSIPSTLRRIVMNEPRPVAELRPEVPQTLSRLVHHLLSKDRERRPPSAAEVLEILRSPSPYQELSSSALKTATTSASPAVSSRSHEPTDPPGANQASKLPTGIQSSSSRWPSAAVWIGALSLLLVVAGASSWFLQSAKELPSIEPGSLVALPARVIGSPEFAYLSEAIPETLTDLLLQVDGLDARLPLSVHRFESIGEDLGRVATTYRVNRCLTSSVNVEIDRMELTVRLVEPSSHRILWTGRYQKPLSGYQDLAREAAEGVRVALQPNSAPIVARERRADAELEYQKGKYYSNQFNTHHQPQDFEQALQALKKALDLDPRLADAAAQIAMLYVFRVEGGQLSPEEAIPQIDSWARQALQMDPGSSLAWTALTAVSSMDPEKNQARSMLAYALKAVQADPRNAMAHLSLGQALDQCHPTLSAPAARTSHARDPLYHYATLNLSNFLRQQGRSTEALQVIEAVLSMEAEFGAGLVNKLVYLLDLGMLDEARAALQPVNTAVEKKLIPPFWSLAGRLGLALAEGDEASIQEGWQETLALFEPDQQIHPGMLHGVVVDLTPLLVQLGKKDWALELLDRADQAGLNLSYGWLVDEPRLRPLRGDPGYEKLVASKQGLYRELLDVLSRAQARGELPHYLEEPLAKLKAQEP